MSFTAPITAYGQAAYDYLEPLHADDALRGFPLQTLIAGLSEGARQVEEAVRAQPGRDPYQQVYDITRTPDFLLPWAGQIVGVQVIGTDDADTQRLQIMAEAGFFRGSVQNLLAAVEKTQTAPRATVVERTPDAWGIAVDYDPAFTPDVTAFTNAAKAAVAWGLALSVNSLSLPLFEEAGPTRLFEGVAWTVTFEAAILTDLS